MEHEELIDRALASYSSAQLEQGFRGRFLSKIGRRRQSGWWVAVPVGAAAYAVWLFHVGPPPQRAIEPPVPYVHETVANTIHPSRVEKSRRSRRVHARAGLTEQERVLARWAEQSPETAAGEWTGFRERSDAPIEISILGIPPIATEEQSQ